MSTKLIVALDFDNQYQALSLIEHLDPKSCALKVGNEMFTHFGVSWVKELIARQFKVFLDLKFHDIPNTVAKACKASADLGVWMTNVHASGGEQMMSAAREALEPYGEQRPILIAVTVLTSFSQQDLQGIGITKTLQQQVTDLARLTHQSGLDGVVCSPHEVKSIKNACSNSFLTITPGVRLEGDVKSDQKRIMTPKEAVAQGSDFLVIGRPITQATDPASVVSSILQQI